MDDAAWASDINFKLHLATLHRIASRLELSAGNDFLAAGVTDARCHAAFDHLVAEEFVVAVEAVAAIRAPNNEAKRPDSGSAVDAAWAYIQAKLMRQEIGIIDAELRSAADSVESTVRFIFHDVARIAASAGLSAAPFIREMRLGEPQTLADVEAAIIELETRLAESDPGASRTSTVWKNVQMQLLQKCDRGEPYTSGRALAAELKCREPMIRKAISRSDTLRGWRIRATGTQASPKATDLDAVVRGNARQTTEPAPNDVLVDDDVDTTMARLIDQARPEERARLNALDTAGRRALVATVQSQNLDDELSPLEPDKSGERSRRVKHYKRA